MDNILCSMLKSAVGFSIHRVDDGRGVWSAVQKLGVAGRSYQDWMFRTPVRLGGMA